MNIDNRALVAVWVHTATDISNADFASLTQNYLNAYRRRGFSKIRGVLHAPQMGVLTGGDRRRQQRGIRNLRAALLGRDVRGDGATAVSRSNATGISRPFAVHDWSTWGVVDGTFGDLVAHADSRRDEEREQTCAEYIDAMPSFAGTEIRWEIAHLQARTGLSKSAVFRLAQLDRVYAAAAKNDVIIVTFTQNKATKMRRLAGLPKEKRERKGDGSYASDAIGYQRLMQPGGPLASWPMKRNPTDPDRSARLNKIREKSTAILNECDERNWADNMPAIAQARADVATVEHLLTDDALYYLSGCRVGA